MVIVQRRSNTKLSGKKKNNSSRTKRKHQVGSQPTLTKLGENKSKKVRTKGGGEKTRLVQTEKVNIYAPKEKKHYHVAIKTILENPSNRNFVRRNIMTKGTVIETEKGKAKITSRPGQDGIVNAVLV